ncbi:MAG: hypothetical protein IKQ67_02915 [Candidatus Methanomethylophilaceae archaeon]|nr:hypothetical protein [Candidatus Methanomethylophilaceae archaeon]
MSSEQVPDIELPLPEMPHDHETPQDFRRRSLRNLILIVLAIAVGICAGGYVLYRYVGPDTLIDIADEYWPIVFAPILGWLLGYWAVQNLYHPTASYYGSLDPNTHEFTIVRIPDEMIKYFDQPGNSVQYHTPLSNRYYPVQKMDLQSGRMEYAWPFDADPQLLFSREESYLRWYEWILGVAKENIQLRDNPLLLAILLTRNHLGKALDGIAAMLNMDGQDASVKDYSMSDLLDSIRGDDNEEKEGGEDDEP